MWVLTSKLANLLLFINKLFLNKYENEMPYEFQQINQAIFGNRYRIQV